MHYVLFVLSRWETFFKYYPYLAIVPIVLLWLAIDRRISAYAWTEQRIYLVALATAITIAYAILIVPKARQYRLISGGCNGGNFLHDLGS